MQPRGSKGQSSEEGSPGSTFRRLSVASYYYLARYAARAFSLLHESLTEANLSL